MLQEDLLNLRQPAKITAPINTERKYKPAMPVSIVPPRFSEEHSQITPLIYLACGVIIGLMSMMLATHIF